MATTRTLPPPTATAGTPVGVPGRGLALLASALQLAAAFLPWAGDGRTALDLGLVTFGGDLVQPTVAVALVVLAAVPALGAVLGDRGAWRGLSAVGTAALVIAWLAAGPDGSFATGVVVALAAVGVHLLAAALARGAVATTPPGEVPTVDDRGLHPTASRGFSGDVGAYERGRPSYPAEAIAHLTDVLGLAPGVRVADVGAGTGKLTRLLLPTGAEVVAVEPVAAMRARVTADLPGLVVLDATAERLPFADGSLDAIVVGQAFHWFDQARALEEFARVLRPGGALALLWNVRDRSSDWVAQLDPIFDAYAGASPRYRTPPDAVVAASGAFTPVEAHRFAHAPDVDVEAVVDRVLSVSFIASLAESERETVERRVRHLLATHPDTADAAVEGRTFPMAYRCEVFTATRLG